MIVFPNCKINLGLHILGKRPDGFHNLQTVFYPIALRDALEVIEQPSATEAVQLTGSGLQVDGAITDNICYKAYQLLKTDFPQLPPIKLHLHKAIPMGAGLGGGSADGAFTLLLLNKNFNLGLSVESLAQYALQLGSDCPFFIKNKACLATGRGDVLEDVAVDLSTYQIAVVNPGIHINTGWAFSQIKPSDSRPSIATVIQQPIGIWKDALTNDFEAPIFAHYPEIAAIKETLYSAGAVYASLSGSGASVYGIFRKEEKPPFNFPPHYFVKMVGAV